MNEQNQVQSIPLDELMAKLDLTARHTDGRGVASPPALNDAAYAPEAGLSLFRSCADGERTQQLAHIAGVLIGAGNSVLAAADICRLWNSTNRPPLDHDKIQSTVESIARTHSRNHPKEPGGDEPLFDFAASSVGRFLGIPAPAREWVLTDVLPLAKACLLVAPGGTGKSQLLLQIAYDVATGRQRHSPYAPAKAAKVVVLSAEDEEDELHRRIQRLAREDLLDPDGEAIAKLLTENLHIVTRVGSDNLMTRMEDRTVVQTQFVKRFAGALAGVENVSLIVLDPVSRFRGGVENAAEDTTRFVEALESLVKSTGATVIAAHHSRKPGPQGNREATQADARGSSALVDGVRLVLNLGYETRDRRSGSPKDDQLLELRITKTNYGAPGEPIFLRRGEGGILNRIDGAEAQAAKDQAHVIEVLRIVSSEAAAGRRYSKSTFARANRGVAGKFGMGEGALINLLTRMVDAELLQIEPGKRAYLTAAKRT